jgi:hypothetical protein
VTAGGPIIVNRCIARPYVAFLSLRVIVDRREIMTKTLRLLGMATLLASGTVTAMAAGSGANSGSSQSVTGTQLGSPQEATPATGSAPNSSAPTYNYSQSGGTGMSTQSYPGKVGPTGSTQPDATNPVRSNPSGGGGSNDAGSGH